jgi:integrase
MCITLPQRTLSGRFQLAALRLGLPEIRFHDLRHTAATLMLEQGVHPKVVQERLGHSNIQMTMNLYSHVSESMGQQAAEALAGAIGE